jgi:hypothetical protein
VGSSFGFLLSSLRCGRADLEAEAVVARFDDVAVMGEAIEHGRRHLCVAENARPFAEAQISRDRDTAALVKLAEQMEQQSSA